MESASGRFHALMLLFVAGMSGFALSGDVFDMFVFFELMGAAAYALTGMKIEDKSAVQGGLTFGIINSLAAYLSLAGVAILYARTGQLGLPQLGRLLSHHRPDALVVAAFVLILAGFMVKGAIVPFHFWVADAHAVAPAPVCALFAGVMVELGLYGVARVYWTAFSGTLPAGDVRHAFLALGALTALVGAVMCVLQRHLKRLLAYSTIAHVGLFTMSFAALSPGGTAGAALYAAGHAGATSALFLIAGVILDRYGNIDELRLYGAGRGERVLPWLWFIAAFTLAGLPPFGIALGRSVAEDAVSGAGYPWALAVFVAVSALTGGAVLRAGARVYLGLGPRPGLQRGGAGRGDQRRGRGAGHPGAGPHPGGDDAGDHDPGRGRPRAGTAAAGPGGLRGGRPAVQRPGRLSGPGPGARGRRGAPGAGRRLDSVREWPSGCCPWRWPSWWPAWACTPAACRPPCGRRSRPPGRS